MSLISLAEGPRSVGRKSAANISLTSLSCSQQLEIWREQEEHGVVKQGCEGWVEMMELVKGHKVGRPMLRSKMMTR